MRLLAGVGQEPRGIELLDRHAAAAIGKKIHFLPPEGLCAKTKRRTDCRRRGARLTRFHRKSHSAAW
jgi:hypothetical protein